MRDTLLRYRYRLTLRFRSPAQKRIDTLEARIRWLENREKITSRLLGVLRDRQR